MMDSEKTTYGQLANELYQELEQRGIQNLDGLSPDGYHRQLVDSSVNFLSIADGQPAQTIDSKGKQLLEDCKQALQDFDKRKKESHGIEELFD